MQNPVHSSAALPESADAAGLPLRGRGRRPPGGSHGTAGPVPPDLRSGRGAHSRPPVHRRRCARRTMRPGVTWSRWRASRSRPAVRLPLPPPWLSRRAQRHHRERRVGPQSRQVAPAPGRTRAPTGPRTRQVGGADHTHRLGLEEVPLGGIGEDRELAPSAEARRSPTARAPHLNRPATSLTRPRVRNHLQPPRGRPPVVSY